MELGLSDGIRLFWLPLDLPAPDLEVMGGWLAPDECERAARFRFPRDRARYIAGRGGVRLRLARCLGAEPAGLRFSYGPWGKPALAAGAGYPRVEFNFSQSQGMGLLAVQSGDEIGVDVEAVRPVPDVLAVAERVFSGRERQLLERAPANQRDMVFARCWTRKEALLKSIGRGLSYPMHAVAVPLDELAEPVAVELDAGGQNVVRWLLPIPAVPPGYIAAVATAGGPRPIHGVPSQPA